ncbi:MAG: hypothetical protein H6R07_2139 [Proteobacteria bacterium]|nr:hypothetical protein [Pseudomonadota bacterium]
MRLLRCFLLLALMFVLPLHASMAGIAQLSENTSPRTSAIEQDAVHEHRGLFGSIELHQHKATDTAKVDSGTSCNSLNGVPVEAYRQPAPVWAASSWHAGDTLFPSDYAPAPPEQPPRACA